MPRDSLYGQLPSKRKFGRIVLRRNHRGKPRRTDDMVPMMMLKRCDSQPGLIRRQGLLALSAVRATDELNCEQCDHGCRDPSECEPEPAQQAAES